MALENGLIVPVIRNADEKNVLGLQRSIVDLATRARSRQLKPDEVQGGTFSITNFGSFGSVFATPVINQPQVAILGAGVVEKEPVVIDDAIAIRSMCYLALTFDHRLIDGALADQFTAKVKAVLENWSEGDTLMGIESTTSGLRRVRAEVLPITKLNAPRRRSSRGRAGSRPPGHRSDR